MVFDRTVVAAQVSAGFIVNAIIRLADDQKAAWMLEFARMDGGKNCMTYARRTCVKTYKTCDAALTDVHAVGIKKVTVLMS
ncbi:hypothetical protein [Azotobacter salinestris]|uniref:hypothetical protein n=1 Tax=Azotobacter salinestris TaxID=69964 RepID=UPI0032DFC142